jgi:hypothetical protein
MKQVPLSEPTNIKRRGIKFIRLDDLALGICASLYYILFYHIIFCDVHVFNFFIAWNIWLDVV